jgi:hypothetical protein
MYHKFTVYLLAPECPAVGKPCLKMGSDGLGAPGPCPVRAMELYAATVKRHSSPPSAGPDACLRPERCTRCRTAAMAVAMPDLTRRLLDKGEPQITC